MTLRLWRARSNMCRIAIWDFKEIKKDRMMIFQKLMILEFLALQNQIVVMSFDKFAKLNKPTSQGGYGDFNLGHFCFLVVDDARYCATTSSRDAAP